MALRPHGGRRGADGDPTGVRGASWPGGWRLGHAGFKVALSGGTAGEKFRGPLRGTWAGRAAAARGPAGQGLVRSLLGLLGPGGGEGCAPAEEALGSVASGKALFQASVSPPGTPKRTVFSSQSWAGSHTRPCAPCGRVRAAPQVWAQPAPARRPLSARPRGSPVPGRRPRGLRWCPPRPPPGPAPRGARAPGAGRGETQPM